MQFAVLNHTCNVTVYTYYLWEQQREKVFGRASDLVLVGPVRESRLMLTATSTDGIMFLSHLRPTRWIFL